MTWTVRGTLDGEPYTLTYDPTAGDTRLLDRLAGSSTSVVAHLLCQQGRAYPVTPTGPGVTLSLDDPRAVLVALLADTTVATVEGDAPGLDADLPDGPLVIA